MNEAKQPLRELSTQTLPSQHHKISFTHSTPLLFRSRINEAVSLRISRTDVVTASFFRHHCEFALEISEEGINTTSTNKRYSEFVDLHNRLSAELSSNDAPLPELPPKKIFGNLDFVFLEERRKCLERYIQSLLTHHRVPTLKVFWNFLDVDDGLIAIAQFLGAIPNETLAEQRLQDLHVLFYQRRNDMYRLSNPLIIERLIRMTSLQSPLLQLRICLILTTVASTCPDSYESLVRYDVLLTILALLEPNSHNKSIIIDSSLLFAIQEFAITFIDVYPQGLLHLFQSQQGGSLILHIVRNAQLTELHSCIALLLWMCLDMPELQIALAEPDSLGMEILGSLYTSQNSTGRLLCGLIVTLLIVRDCFASTDLSLPAIKSVNNLPFQLQDASCRQHRLALFPMYIQHNILHETFQINSEKQIKSQEKQQHDTLKHCSNHHYVSNDQPTTYLPYRHNATAAAAAEGVTTYPGLFSKTPPLISCKQQYSDISQQQQQQHLKTSPPNYTNTRIGSFRFSDYCVNIQNAIKLHPFMTKNLIINNYYKTSSLHQNNNTNNIILKSSLPTSSCQTVKIMTPKQRLSYNYALPTPGLRAHANPNYFTPTITKKKNNATETTVFPYANDQKQNSTTRKCQSLLLFPTSSSLDSGYHHKRSFSYPHDNINDNESHYLKEGMLTSDPLSQLRYDYNIWCKYHHHHHYEELDFTMLYYACCLKHSDRFVSLLRESIFKRKHLDTDYIPTCSTTSLSTSSCSAFLLWILGLLLNQSHHTHPRGILTVEDFERLNQSLSHRTMPFQPHLPIVTTVTNNRSDHHDYTQDLNTHYGNHLQNNSRKFINTTEPSQKKEKLRKILFDEESSHMSEPMNIKYNEHNTYYPSISCSSPSYKLSLPPTYSSPRVKKKNNKHEQMPQSAACHLPHHRLCCSKQHYKECINNCCNHIKHSIVQHSDRTKNVSDNSNNHSYNQAPVYRNESDEQRQAQQCLAAQNNSYPIIPSYFTSSSSSSLYPDIWAPIRNLQQHVLSRLKTISPYYTGTTTSVIKEQRREDDIIFSRTQPPVVEERQSLSSSSSSSSASSSPPLRTNDNNLHHNALMAIQKYFKQLLSISPFHLRPHLTYNITPLNRYLLTALSKYQNTLLPPRELFAQIKDFYLLLEQCLLRQDSSMPPESYVFAAVSLLEMPWLQQESNTITSSSSSPHLLTLHPKDNNAAIKTCSTYHNNNYDSLRIHDCLLQLFDLTDHDSIPDTTRVETNEAGLATQSTTLNFHSNEFGAATTWNASISSIDNDSKYIRKLSTSSSLSKETVLGVGLNSTALFPTTNLITSTVSNSNRKKSLLPTIDFVIPQRLLRQRLDANRLLLCFSEAVCDTQREAIRTEDAAFQTKETAVTRKHLQLPIKDGMLENFFMNLEKYVLTIQMLLQVKRMGRSFISDTIAREETLRVTRSSLAVHANSIEVELRRLCADTDHLYELRGHASASETQFRKARASTDDLLKRLVGLNNELRKTQEVLRESSRIAQRLRDRWIELEQLIAEVPQRRKQLTSQLNAREKQESNILKELQTLEASLSELQVRNKQQALDRERIVSHIRAVNAAVNMLQIWAKNVQIPLTLRKNTYNNSLSRSPIVNNKENSTMSPQTTASTTAPLITTTVANTLGTLQPCSDDSDSRLANNVPNSTELSAEQQILDDNKPCIILNEISLENHLDAFHYILNLLPKSFQHAELKGLTGDTPNDATVWAPALYSFLQHCTCELLQQEDVQIKSEKMASEIETKMRNINERRRLVESELKKRRNEEQQIKQALAVHGDTKTMIERSAQLQTEVRASDEEVQKLTANAEQLEARVRSVEAEIEKKKAATRSLEGEFLTLRDNLLQAIEISNETRRRISLEIVKLESKTMVFLSDISSVQEDRMYAPLNLALLDYALNEESEVRSNFKKQIIKLIDVLQATLKVMQNIDTYDDVFKEK